MYSPLPVWNAVFVRVAKEGVGASFKLVEVWNAVAVGVKREFARAFGVGVPEDFLVIGVPVAVSILAVRLEMAAVARDAVRICGVRSSAYFCAVEESIIVAVRVGRVCDDGRVGDNGAPAAVGVGLVIIASSVFVTVVFWVIAKVSAEVVVERVDKFVVALRILYLRHGTAAEECDGEAFEPVEVAVVCFECAADNGYAFG